MSDEYIDDIDTQEEAVVDQPAQEEDPIKNLKAEFNRKLQNIEASNQQLANMMKEEVSNLASYMKSGKDSDIDLEDLKYSDPDKYVDLKMRSLEDNIMKKVESSQTQMTQKQQVLGQLVSQFPELNDPGSELYGEAVRVAQTLDPSIKDTAHGYKLAVMEAVNNLGVSPVSRRKKQVADEFISSGSSSANSGAPKKKAKSNINDHMLKFAELLGRDINDPEFIKRLEQAAKRKNWNRYQ